MTTGQDGGDGLDKLIRRLRARADKAYCDMISLARKDESLGWEIKVKLGLFGRTELDAHIKGGELLGRHRALHEAANMLQELSDNRNQKCEKSP